MISVLPVTGLGEIGPGDDLAALVAAAFPLEDGDVVVVTSKVVSKAEGRVVAGGRTDVLAAETDRVVATRGDTAIVRTQHGLVMAAAGVDASNTDPGTVVLLPRDPDASARAVREGLHAAGSNVAVVVTDTAGRAWRNGQTDLAIGVAGLQPLHDYAGRLDDYGNPLAVTAPAVADEIAAAADLVKGKLDRRPVAVLRGAAGLVLPPGRHGPGAAALVRPEAHDMFGYGAREAVLAAAGADPAGLRGFGAPAPQEVVRAALRRVATGSDGVEAQVSGGAGEVAVVLGPAVPRAVGRLEARLCSVAFAHAWLPAGADGADEPEAPTPGDSVARLRFRPATP